MNICFSTMGDAGNNVALQAITLLLVDSLTAVHERSFDNDLQGHEGSEIEPAILSSSLDAVLKMETTTSELGPPQTKNPQSLKKAATERDGGMCVVTNILDNRETANLSHAERREPCGGNPVGEQAMD